MQKYKIKISRFKDKCDICDEWKNDCAGYKGMIICKSCYEKEYGKVELDEPEQTTIFDFLKDS